MKFRAFGRMQSCPSISLDTTINPLDFETSLHGSFHGELGPFKGYVGEIPIRLAIPFLKRKPVIASIGGFPLSLDRFQVNVNKAGLDLKGVIGSEGIKAKVHSKVECSTEMKLEGRVSGQFNLSDRDLDEEDDGHCKTPTCGGKLTAENEP
ncbi:MAG: hypothetical protein EPN14_09340 [Gallionella sp.]|nr:MAG: hypothetical protein EPN14_09340 [Gallionella sp.]